MNPVESDCSVFARFLLVCASLFLFSCQGSVDMQADSSRISTGSWEEHPASPILMPGHSGSWNEKRADTGNSIVQYKGRWYLYHSGMDARMVSRIGLQVSAGDDIFGPWRAARGRAVLEPGVAGSWDSLSVAHPSVIILEGVFWMYYSGTDGRQRRIGLARSGNGIDWKKLPTPVFSSGPEGSWDAGGVNHPSVVHDGRRFVMAYAGWLEGRSPIRSQIGIAVSADGLKWSRLPDGPVLGYGEKGSWDEMGLMAPRLWVEKGRYYLTYTGREVATAMSSLGHATAGSLDRWARSSNNPMLHHSRVRYHQLVWATPVWFEQRWYILSTADLDGGATTLWQEIIR